MANGTIKSSYPSGLDIIIEWSSKGNFATQTSSVTAKVYVSHRDVYCAALSGSYLKAGDTVYSFQKALSSSNTALTKTLVFEKTFTVSHQSDGKASVELSAGYVFNGTYGGYSVSTVAVSGKAVLDTLLSKSGFDTVSTVTLGEAETVKVRTDGGGKKYKISLKVGTETYITGFLQGSALSFTPPKTLAYGMTDCKKKTGTLTLESFTSGGVSLGGVSESVTVVIPDTADFAPSFEFGVDVTSNVPYLNNKGIAAAGLSKIHVSISEPSTKYGAAVDRYIVKIGGRGYYAQSLDCEIKNSGDLTVVGAMFDTRGNSKTASETVYVYPYRAPYFTGVESYRCDEAGEKTDGGSFVFVKCEASVCELDGGNTANITATVKDRSGNKITSCYLKSGESAVLNPPLVPTRSYKVEFACRDSVGRLVTSCVMLPTERVDIHVKDGALRLGGVIEKAGFDCTYDADFGGEVSIGGEKITDYVVESGESGVWTYRRWKSGFAECFGLVDRRIYDVSTECEEGYRSVSDSTENGNSVSYPEKLFSERPIVTVNAVSYGFPVQCRIGAYGTNAVTPRYYMVSRSSGTCDVELFVHAVGKHTEKQ